MDLQPRQFMTVREQDDLNDALDLGLDGPAQTELFDGASYDESDKPWRLPFEASETTYHSSGNPQVTNKMGDFPDSLIHAGTLDSAGVRADGARPYVAELRPAKGTTFGKAPVSTDRLANLSARELEPNYVDRHSPGPTLGTDEGSVKDPDAAVLDDRVKALNQGQLIPYVNEMEDKGSISYVGRNDAFTTRYEQLQSHQGDLTHGTEVEFDRYSTYRRNLTRRRDAANLNAGRVGQLPMLAPGTNLARPEGDRDFDLNPPAKVIQPALVGPDPKDRRQYPYMMPFGDLDKSQSPEAKARREFGLDR